MSPRKRAIGIRGQLDTHTNFKNTIIEGLDRYSDHFEFLAKSETPVTDVCLVIEDTRPNIKGLYLTGETEDGFVVLKFDKDGKYDIEADAKVISKAVLVDLELEPEIGNMYAFFDNTKNTRASKHQVAAVMRCYLSSEKQSQLMSASAIASYFGDAAELFVDRVLQLIG
jgi:hypothetical protein